jgi:glycosyltransferase involved in cell wall biosynthesis
MNIDQSPLLTVCIITYNHEKFIAETLNSVLMQKTNFSYTIIVGEDCSTDRTRAILLEYKEKHPHKIELLLNEKNLGPQRNLMNVHNTAQTKYIAMLDGDDYWTDPDKLQTQVDFMDKNDDYAGCFHKILFKTIDTSKIYTYPNNVIKNSFTIEDVIAMSTTGWLIMTSSFVYNKKKTGNLPDWMIGLKVGDMTVNLLVGHSGKIQYIDKIMANYRENTGSLMTTEAYNKITMVKERIKIFKFFDRHTNFIYNTSIQKQLLALYYELIKHFDDSNQFIKSYYYSLLFNFHNIKLRHHDITSLKKMLIFIADCSRYIFKKVQHGNPQ